MILKTSRERRKWGNWAADEGILGGQRLAAWPHHLLLFLKKKQYSIALGFPLRQLLPASPAWWMSKTDMQGQL